MFSIHRTSDTADHGSTTPYTREKGSSRDVSTTTMSGGSAVKRTSSSRGIRSVVYFLLIGIMLLRLPQTHEMVQERLPGEQVAELGPELVGVAVSLALMVGVTGFFIIMALYLSLAAALDQYLYSGSFPLLGRQRNVRIGHFTTVVFCAIFPIQTWALFAGDLPPTSVRLLVVTVICAGLLIATRRSLTELPPHRAIVVSASTMVLVSRSVSCLTLW